MLSVRSSIRGLATQVNQASSTIQQNVEATQSVKEERNDKTSKPKRLQPNALLHIVKTNVNNELDQHIPVQKIYSQLQSELQELVSQNRINTRAFGNINLFNTALSRLIRQSKLELESQNLGDSNSIPPAPYDILQTSLKYNLARHQHFTLVMRQYLNEKKFEEVMNLWVTFLEHAKKIPLNTAATKQIQVLTSISYLMLCSQSKAKPEAKVITQLLNTTLDEIPFLVMEQEMKSLKLDSSAEEALFKCYSDLLLEWFVSDKDAFINGFLKRSNDYKLLSYLWNQYLKFGAADYTSSDLQIPSAFIVRFAELNKSLDSMKIVAQLKEASPDFKPNVQIYNALLEAVAYTPAFGRQATTVKLDRIQAIWNSCIKTQENIGVDSYKSMLRALNILGNVKTAESFWALDVPNDMKSNKELSDVFSMIYFNSDECKDYSKLKQKIPKKIDNLELANTILLAMVNVGAPASDVDSFYDRIFLSTTGIKPNDTTLATRLLANIKLSKLSDNADILSTIGVSHSSERVVPIIEEYLKLCTDEESATALLKALKLDVKGDRFALKVSKFLNFYLEHGQWEVAEDLFKQALTENAKSPTLINFRMFNSMFQGFSELSISKNDTGFISKQQVYWELCDQIHHKIFKESIISTLKSIAELSRRKADFSESELDFINNTVLPYLVKAKANNEFVVQNPRLLKNIKTNDKIHIPKELL